VIPKDLTPALLEGDVREVLRRLPDETIHCVVTSPPYWGLRDYGIPPVRWGGKASCPHQWEGVPPRRKRSPEDVRNPGSIQAGHVGANITLPVTRNCSRCGGWLGQLGLEPDPDLFVDHLASVVGDPLFEDRARHGVHRDRAVLPAEPTLPVDRQGRPG
jgi:site-specific DNA-methyltransferase (cytosine-N4-specific)